MAKKAKQKVFKKVSTAALEAWLDTNGLSRSKSAELLGVSASAIGHYLKIGECSPAIDLAVKYLRAANGKGDPDDVAHFLLTVAGPGNFVVKELQDLEQMTMKGRQYVLIPIN